MSQYESYIKDYQKTPKGKFIRHRANANRREIPWDMTFEEWWKIWQDSGKWEERGNKAGQYCMARIKDEGPYAVGNVEITTISENSQESAKQRWKEPTEWQPTPWADRKSAWDIY